MIYRLLGDLEISWDGQALTLPSGRSLAVLSALLLRPNRRVAKSVLLEAAWGSSGAPEAQLHKAANTLRHFLAQMGRRDDLVTHQGFGYELRIASGDLDLTVFHRLVREAEEAMGQGHGCAAVGSLRRALELWRGPHPLANVGSEWLTAETKGLEQRRKLSAVRLFDLEISARRYSQVLHELAQVARDYPADQRLCEQLMIVAYRCGHPADASEAFVRHESALGRDLGAAPAPGVRDLHYAVASGNRPFVEQAEAVIAERARGLLSRATPEEVPGTAAAAPAPAVRGAELPAAAIPRQLPPRAADFTGRGSLIQEASWLLGRTPPEGSPDPPVIVIHGTGGVGKTALALEVAHQSARHYPDGQLYIDLGGSTAAPMDPGEVLAQFLRALGVQQVPETRAERATALRSLLADRRVLIVLDDALSGAQVSALIPAHAGCGVLITARQRLADLEAGRHHVPPLVPLDRETARDLFARRVRAFGIDLAGEENAVDTVVALCGGLPLALRIAAALRVHHHPQSTAELARWLARQGLEGFEFGDQSLARTIGTGWERLGEPAKQLFAGLGLVRLRSFAPWTAAALLARPEPGPSRALAELAARSMLEPAGPGVRFRFHELTRDYAYRLASQQETGAARRRDHAARVYRALLSLTRWAHAGLYGGDFEVVHCDEPAWDEPPEAVLELIADDPEAWFEAERVNIRAAVSHCAELGLTGIAWDLAFSAHELYTVGGYFDDWYATSRAALAACLAGGDRRGEAVMLTSLGQPALVASCRAGQVSGLPELERAAALLAECGDRHGQAIALRTIASALRRRGLLARPLRLFGEALAGYQAAADRVGEWQVRRLIGHTYLDMGEYGPALEVLREAQQAAGLSKRLLAQSWYWIGLACLAAGDTGGARPAFDAVLAAYPDPPEVGHAYALHGQAELARLTGAPAEAAGRLATAADLARAGHDAGLEGRVHLSEALLRQDAGQPAAETRALEEAARCFAAGGTPGYELRALDLLGRALDRNGDHAGAQEAWARAAAVYAVMDLPAEDQVHRPPPGPGRP